MSLEALSSLKEAAVPDEGCTEATFRMIVNNFSKLNETVLSPPTFIRKLPWKIMVMPRILKTYDEDKKMETATKFMGFFLQCNVESDSSKNDSSNKDQETWSCNATAVLRLVSQKEEVQTFTREIQHLFYCKENDWGFSRFIQWAEILKQEKGFIKDDTIILEVNVKADTPCGVAWTRCCSISKTVQDMFRDGYLADFNLKVGERTFPVHKSILGMRSKVFRAMFDSGMKEMQENCVEIKDFDGDTLQRMLEFIYLDRIDKDMDLTEASSLFAAADFYALELLKQSCSSILKNGLSVTSVLGVLALADLHQDQQLKSAAIHFFLRHPAIIGTEDWNKFQKDSGNLVLDIFKGTNAFSIKMDG